MGCHTWFSRPITDEEFKKMKEYASKEIYYFTGNSQENIEDGLYDKNLYNLLMKSCNENIPEYNDLFRVNYPPPKGSGLLLNGSPD